MEKMGKHSFNTRRIVFDAMLIAMFFVLSSVSFRIGNTFKITFDSLACLLTALLFGPLDAFLVGFLGEFMAQMLSYGFTATTLLWILGPAMRGLVLGLGIKMVKDRMNLGWNHKKQMITFMLVVCIASIITSLLNTFALYVDSRLFGYYEYHMVFGVLLIRLATGIISSIAMAVIAVPVFQALKAAKMIPSV